MKLGALTFKSPSVYVLFKGKQPGQQVVRPHDALPLRPAGLEALGRRARADDAPALAHERAGRERLLERLHHLLTAQGRDGHASSGPARAHFGMFRW